MSYIVVLILTHRAAARTERLDITPKRRDCKVNSELNDEFFKESEPQEEDKMGVEPWAKSYGL